MTSSARKPAAKTSVALSGYLQKILTARVYDVAVETALDAAPALSARIGNHVFLKREDTQPVFSFKLRGAYNKMAHLTPAQLRRGVICASAGNHAQGVALAAHRLGCKAFIVIPVTTPSLKIDAVRALGGEVVLHGDSYSDAHLHAMQLKAERGLTFVHPFDDPDVIAGQGTIAMEILRQHQGPIDAVFVAIGGGWAGEAGSAWRDALWRSPVRLVTGHGLGASPGPALAGLPGARVLALWFELDDFDAAVERAAALGAEVVMPPHRNPPDGPGGPAHRELWLRDPDGYLIVVASPDGESPWPDPRVG